jgi:hypothetical protein
MLKGERMAERLRESWGAFELGNSRVLNESEIEQLKLPRLTESFSGKEAVILRERLNETDQKMFGEILNRLEENGLQNKFKIWKLPIGKYGNLNGNKRVYPLKLWENVRDKQADTWKGFCGLCDHPEKDNDPGEFKNQAVIWHGIDVPQTGGTVYGYASFVGPYGALAQEILEHGGRVGTSSSGFGDVDPVSKVVDPDTYVIERLADLVLNPSQGTFGTAATCTHTAPDFLTNVGGGATIEYERNRPMKEAAQQTARSQIMAQQATTYDAANPQVESSTKAAPPAGQTAPDANRTAVDSQPVKESLQESTKMERGTMAKVEEKAVRKHIQQFLADAGNIENPLKRLSECVEIMECLEDAAFADLKESISQQLLEEKDALEKLVETVVATEKDYDMNIGQFREAAERNTAQGMLLQEQVTDYRELCDGLAKRNLQLKEENETLKKKLSLHNKLTEKRSIITNKEIVSKSSQVEKLEESIEKLETKNERLMERISKLAMSNGEFEKENSMLTAKLKEAGEIMKGVKTQKLTESKAATAASEEIARLKEQVRELEQINEEITSNYDTQSNRYDQLLEKFENYRKEVKETFDPTARLMPMATERIGKYLDLRENKGIEIETYWNDQVKKYGEAMLPFEDKIRGAKTLQEATINFLKYRTQIDSNFAVAQPQEHAYRNRAERAQLYEAHGIVNPIQQYQEASTEQKNEEFLASLKAAGLQ